MSKTQFSTGAVRDTLDGKPRTDLLPFDLLLRIADWYGFGADKYGGNNWRKGQKVSHCVGSIMRHLSKWVMGQRDEDHLAAIVFNVFSIMNVETYMKDNKDIYDLDYSMESWFASPKEKGFECRFTGNVRMEEELALIVQLLQKWIDKGLVGYEVNKDKRPYINLNGPQKGVQLLDVAMENDLWFFHRFVCDHYPNHTYGKLHDLLITASNDLIQLGYCDE